MNIAIDIMGGDYAPEEALKGVKVFFESEINQDVNLVLIGNSKAAEPFMDLILPYQNRYTFIESTQVIGMNEHPTKALKEKPDSSIAIGYKIMAQRKADAFIGAGNTGAMMVGAMYTLKTIEGILRPVIASPIPREDGTHSLILDVGANADCKPEHLVQFAELGTLYSHYVLGVEHPKVGLLNLGEEEGKGNLLCQATYPLLKENSNIDFHGNIEGRDILRSKVDVIVCEGFVGNVALKLAESVYDLFAVGKAFQDTLLDQFNFEIYGGTPIIGINEPVIIGHGISREMAFHRMIEVAAKIVNSGFVPALKTHLSKQHEAISE